MASTRKSRPKVQETPAIEQKRTSEPVLALGAVDVPPEQKKPAERAETQKSVKPEEYILARYGIERGDTRIPRLLYALLCEAVNRRVGA